MSFRYSEGRITVGNINADVLTVNPEIGARHMEYNDDKRASIIREWFADLIQQAAEDEGVMLRVWRDGTTQGPYGGISDQIVLAIEDPETGLATPVTVNVYAGSCVQHRVEGHLEAEAEKLAFDQRVRDSLPKVDDEA